MKQNEIKGILNNMGGGSANKNLLSMPNLSGFNVENPDQGEVGEDAETASASDIGNTIEDIANKPKELENTIEKGKELSEKFKKQNADLNKGSQSAGDLSKSSIGEGSAVSGSGGKVAEASAGTAETTAEASAAGGATAGGGATTGTASTASAASAASGGSEAAAIAIGSSIIEVIIIILIVLVLIVILIDIFYSIWGILLPQSTVSVPIAQQNKEYGIDMGIDDSFAEGYNGKGLLSETAFINQVEMIRDTADRTLDIARAEIKQFAIDNDFNVKKTMDEFDDYMSSHDIYENSNWGDVLILYSMGQKKSNPFEFNQIEFREYCENLAYAHCLFNIHYEEVVSVSGEESIEWKDIDEEINYSRKEIEEGEAKYNDKYVKVNLLPFSRKSLYTHLEYDYQAVEQVTTTLLPGNEPMDMSVSDFDLLCKTVWHEARGEGKEGWIGVAEVILNRVKSSYFPNTVSAVVYAPGQFQNAEGILAMKPSEECISVCKQVCAGSLGVLNNDACIGFFNPGRPNYPQKWNGWNFYKKINHHCFYIHPNIKSQSPKSSSNIKISNGFSAEKVDITIPTLTKDYNIAWISDLHLMFPASKQPAVNNSKLTAWGGLDGRNSANNKNSYQKVDKLIATLNSNNFDAIILGGDIEDNYSSINYEEVKRLIKSLRCKHVYYILADHDYNTDFLENIGPQKGKVSGITGVECIDIGDNGNVLKLVCEGYSTEDVSGHVGAIQNVVDENTLFFSHVPVQSITEASKMRNASLNGIHKEIYFRASGSRYSMPSGYQDAIAPAAGVFAGHMHESYDGWFDKDTRQHTFNGALNGYVGVISVHGGSNTAPPDISDATAEQTQEEISVSVPIDGFLKRNNWNKTDDFFGANITFDELSYAQLYMINQFYSEEIDRFNLDKETPLAWNRQNYPGCPIDFQEGVNEQTYFNAIPVTLAPHGSGGGYYPYDAILPSEIMGETAPVVSSGKKMCSMLPQIKQYSSAVVKSTGKTFGESARICKKGTMRSAACCDCSYMMIGQYWTRTQYTPDQAWQLSRKYVNSEGSFNGVAYLATLGLKQSGNIGGGAKHVLETIVSEIDEGRPLIVHIRGKWYPSGGGTGYHTSDNGHFLTAVGYDEKGVYVNDPGTSKNDNRVIPWSDWYKVNDLYVRTVTPK